MTTPNTGSDKLLDRGSEDLMGAAARFYAVLRDFPCNGQLHNVDPATAADLVISGYVERRETQKPCPACGTLKFDHGWFHITGGGRLFMAVMEARNDQG